MDDPGAESTVAPPLPDPPASPPGPSAPDPAPLPLRPGQLVAGWRAVFISGWVAVIAAFGAVAQAGRLAGISPWWIGPETNPRNVFVFLLPFYAPVAAIVTAARGVRWASYIGLVAAAVSAAIALGDSEYPGMLLVELVIAGCGLALSAASFAGRAVRPPATDRSR